jgi:AcrR family transcriptional regulator
MSNDHPAPEPRGVRHRTPDEIIETAERLFATHGVDAVSLRQVAVEAGHKNHAVVQYHFGSKAGLIQAIIERRLPEIAARRLELLDQLRGASGDLALPSIAEAMTRPLLELDPDDHYVEFLARVSERAEFRDALLATGYHAHSVDVVDDSLERALPSLPPRVLAHRMQMVRALILNAIADRRRLIAAHGVPALSDDEFADDLCNAVAAVFGAPYAEGREPPANRVGTGRSGQRPRYAVE